MTLCSCAYIMKYNSPCYDKRWLQTRMHFVLVSLLYCFLWIRLLAFRLAGGVRADLQSCGWVDKVDAFMSARKKLCRSTMGNLCSDNELRSVDSIILIFVICACLFLGLFKLSWFFWETEVACFGTLVSLLGQYNLLVFYWVLTFTLNVHQLIYKYGRWK